MKSRTGKKHGGGGGAWGGLGYKEVIISKIWCCNATTTDRTIPSRQKIYIKCEIKTLFSHPLPCFYLVSCDLWLVLQSVHLVPSQDDLGVGSVPHDFARRLTGGCREKKGEPLNKQQHQQQTLFFFFHFKILDLRGGKKVAGGLDVAMWGQNVWISVGGGG